MGRLFVLHLRIIFPAKAIRSHNVNTSMAITNTRKVYNVAIKIQGPRACRIYCSPQRILRHKVNSETQSFGRHHAIPFSYAHRVSYSMMYRGYAWQCKLCHRLIPYIESPAAICVLLMSTWGAGISWEWCQHVMLYGRQGQIVPLHDSLYPVSLSSNRDIGFGGRRETIIINLYIDYLACRRVQWTLQHIGSWGPGHNFSIRGFGVSIRKKVHESDRCRALSLNDIFRHKNCRGYESKLFSFEISQPAFLWRNPSCW